MKQDDFEKTPVVVQTEMETQPSHPANSEPFRVVFIGNPGTGKSTLMNGLIGEAKFDSGISLGLFLPSYDSLKFLDGIGVTRQITLFTHNGITYCDTPGLGMISLCSFVFLLFASSDPPR